jgi:hypothetical protein
MVADDDITTLEHSLEFYRALPELRARRGA